jgi:hypothetical protein
MLGGVWDPLRSVGERGFWWASDLRVVAAFVSDYTSPRFADDRPGIGGVDREPSLAASDGGGRRWLYLFMRHSF